jgi:acetyl-CoA carboxylase carboxyltransferase component
MQSEISVHTRERAELEVLLAEVDARHENVLDLRRPEAVAKQHAKGALTARQRIGLLLDDGESFLEYGALARPANRELEGAADGVVVGFGKVHGCVSAFFSYDYTVLGASQGRISHAKTSRTMSLARQLDAPIFMLTEGAGARTQELSLFRTFPKVGDFSALARMSGRVPITGMAFGRAFAGQAIFLGESDVVIAVETAAIGIAGPPLVKASTGEDLTPEQLGGARFHEASGAAELVVSDDAAAIAAGRAYARYVLEPIVPFGEPAGGIACGTADQLRGLALASADGPLDMQRVVELVADPDSTLELRPTWSSSVRTVLARIGGRSVGIVATDPRSQDGVLSADACDKIARFIYLCDAFGMPLVFLVDTAGVSVAEQALAAAMPRHAARIPLALSIARVPICTFVLGSCPGVAQLLVGGVGRSHDLLYYAMWPTARLRGLGITPEDQAGHPLRIAESFAVDDVIDPGATRAILLDVIGAVPLLGRRRPHHQIDPW